MQRQTLILLIFFIISGCSVSRKARFSDTTGHRAENVSLKNIADRNITNQGFFISKAELTISGKNLDEKVFCSIKYNVDGKYLISVRSRSGIEAARILITKDTVLLNNRINRKLYYGSEDGLKKKYGFSDILIPLIFGDYIGRSEYIVGEINCSEGILRKRDEIEGFLIDYVVDCSREKTVSAKQGGTGEISFNYKNFKVFGKTMIPVKIEISDSYRNIKIELKIEKIESPWDGLIEFIPGSKYQMIPLL